MPSLNRPSPLIQPDPVVDAFTSAVGQAFTAALDQLNEQLDSKIRPWENALKSRIEALEAELAGLREQNTALKSQLSEALSERDLPRPTSTIPLSTEPSVDGCDQTRKPLATISTNSTLNRTPALAPHQLKASATSVGKGKSDQPVDKELLKNKLEALHADHSRILSDNNKLKAFNAKLQEATRQRQKTQRTWLAYAEHLEKELGIYGNKTETEPRFSAAVQAKKNHRAGTRDARPADHDLIEDGALQKPSPFSSFSSKPDALEPVLAPIDHVLRSETILTVPSSLQPRPRLEASSNQEGSTQSGSEDETENDLPPHTDCDSATAHGDPVVKAEPSSDVPQVVMERLVKKRKLPEGDAPWPHKVEEEESVDLNYVNEAIAASSHESLDLDDATTAMPTPKKRRRSIIPGEFQHDESVFGTTEASTTRNSELRTRRNPDQMPRRNPGHEPESEVSEVRSDPFEFKPLDNLLEAPAGARKKQQILPPFARRGEISKSGKAARRVTTSALAPHPNQPFTPKAAPSGNAPASAPSLGSRTLIERPPAHISGTTRGKPKLRETPVYKLRREDFKPNPLHSDGFNFAYGEVVRGKDARASLSGCIDPTCEHGKKFLDAARAEMNHLGRSKALKSSGSVEMMEKYLGPNAYRLFTMEPEESEEVWVQARAQVEADKYSRCRHRFARERTPEQFWNTGFPSTQELVRDRLEGEKREREVVEERWREAMKRGKWLFRDE